MSLGRRYLSFAVCLYLPVYSVAIMGHFCLKSVEMVSSNESLLGSQDTEHEPYIRHQLLEYSVY